MHPFYEIEYKYEYRASIKKEIILQEETCWVSTSTGLGLVGCYKGQIICFMLPLLVEINKNPSY